MLYNYIIIYFILINLISFFVCLWDKRMSQKGGWRVAENTLFLLVFLGGSIGMYLTMLKIRHKTKHKRFMLGIPIIMILQISSLLYIFSKF